MILTGYQDHTTTSPRGVSKQLLIVRYCGHPEGVNLQSRFAVDGAGAERGVADVAVQDGDRPVEVRVLERREE